MNADIIPEYTFEIVETPREIALPAEISLPVLARAAVAAGNAG